MKLDTYKIRFKSYKRGKEIQKTTLKHSKFYHKLSSLIQGELHSTVAFSNYKPSSIYFNEVSATSTKLKKARKRGKSVHLVRHTAADMGEIEEEACFGHGS